MLTKIYFLICNDNFSNKRLTMCDKFAYANKWGIRSVDRLFITNFIILLRNNSVLTSEW
jgi:hypothetical protein